MANQVLAFSNRAIFYGHLFKRSFRKKLIFVRRDFDTIDPLKTNPVPTDPGHAFITCGNHLTNEYKIQYKYDLNPRIAWIDYYEQYLSNRRLTQMTNPVQAMHRFSVIISSLPYIHNDSTSKEPTKHIVNYFKNLHRKQGGCHVFVRREGTVMTVNTYMSDKGYRVNPIIAPLSAIYPVMRIPYPNQNIQLTQPQLALGLYYNTFANNLGDRYYHRFGDQCLQRGNVFEVIEAESAVPILNALIEETQPYTAFYVCTGAKLVVLDQYTKGYLNAFNRSLVQQGGIVLFRGSIMISIARTGPHGADRSTIRLRLLTWDELINNNMIPVVPNTPLPGINQNQKVIFLGAQDGHFNSIAWQLDVRTHNRERVISLLTPHDARFEAITNGPDGIREIRNRIYYELLHDSVLTLHGTQFVNPGYDMARLILNPNQSRSYTARYDQDYINRVDTHPREFNLVYPTGENIEQFVQAQTRQLAAPPMYPPQLWNFNKSDHEVTFLPSKQLNYKDVENNCYKTIKLGGLCKHWYTELYHKPQGRRYYKTECFRGGLGDQFERLKQEADHNFNLKNGRVGAAVHYRLGVDGWMYKSTNEPIFTQNSTVYLKVTKGEIFWHTFTLFHS